MIKFSIIIPVKELNNYLDESIPILLGMDYNDFEIIILPNDKPRIKPEYLKNKKVRVIETGKVSPAVKRDIGAKEAKGEYVAFMDDDAYPEKDWISNALKNFPTPSPCVKKEEKKSDRTAKNFIDAIRKK